MSIQTTEESPTESRSIWQLYNNQGPTWSYAQISINERKNFNVVFEGTWGPNRASGSIGIDDIAFYTGNCSGKLHKFVDIRIFLPQTNYVVNDACSETT